MTMASSVFLSPIRSSAVVENREVLGSSSLGFHKSSFLQYSKRLFSSSSAYSVPRKPKSITTPRCCYGAGAGESFDHIPKQFREENLKDGLMDNYENTPQCLYGLSPSQMNMFLTENSPVRRQAEKVTEESISSAYSYMNNGGMWSMSTIKGKGLSNYGSNVSMYLAGGGYYGRRRTPPPDLPSLLLDSRIVYLGMPLVPAVTELLVAQFLWLDFDNQTKPIYLYINSSGTLNESQEIVASETNAFVIADCMSFCKAPVYTVNLAMAHGQAAMLLSLGAKGYRALQPNSSTKLYLPKASRSSGVTTDIWIRAKEVDVSVDYSLELLAKGIGKSREEIRKDILLGKPFKPQEAIDYGIADRIIEPSDVLFEKKNYEEMLAQSKAMSRSAREGNQAAPSG